MLNVMATGYVTVFYFSVKLMAIIKHFVLSRKQMLLLKIFGFFASLVAAYLSFLCLLLL